MLLLNITAYVKNVQDSLQKWKASSCPGNVFNFYLLAILSQLFFVNFVKLSGFTGEIQEQTS